MLALCHTIITEASDKGEIIYNASSPDELALINFARFAGVEYQGIDPDNFMHISFRGMEFKYRLLQTLEFTSARKRMSVILETEKGELLLYCKGADSILLERMKKDK
jgi:phospholipid-transporting ATPase